MEKMLQALADDAPTFLTYAISCYGYPAALFSDGFTLASEEGEHQGCPCGPLFFAITLARALKRTMLPDTVWSHWYLDDGYLAGPIHALHDTLPAIESAALSVGLHLNRKKSAIIQACTSNLPDSLLPRVPASSPPLVPGSWALR